MEKLISMTINGQSVSGTITDLSRAGLSVEITAPFSGYSAHRYVPTFARASRNFLEIGDQVASELLSELYNDLLLLDGKRQSLQAVLHGCEGIFSKLAEHKAVQAELSTKKPELKQQFRAGLLDQKQYQQSLKRIRDQDFQQSMLARELVDQFIEQHLPGWQHSLDHDQLIGFLSSD
ncbi:MULTISPECIES: hypothetical protein [unclassified Endozoicomonas]|uniref:hypothetical protein n=1 Tax=Endozoicomonas TaxID=305899 RepID=UPI003BB524F7